MANIKVGVDTVGFGRFDEAEKKSRAFCEIYGLYSDLSAWVDE